MGVGGGSTAGAWVTYRPARACAWSASRRVERVSDIPRNESFRTALAVILRARERLRDVDGGQAHLEKIVRHMEDLNELHWDLLGQDYDGYDGDGPSGGISERMIVAGLGERGSLDIPLEVWNANIPTRLIWDIRSWKSGPDCGRFDVWQPSLLREFFDNHAVGLDIYRFHYLDDVVMLSRGREGMDSLGPRLAAFLVEKGLCMSTKSCLEPHQNVLWLGKVFDLAKGEVRNTDKMLAKCLGDCHQNGLLACVPKGSRAGHGKNAMGVWTTQGGSPYL